jgi:hypothetical protein
VKDRHAQDTRGALSPQPTRDLIVARRKRWRAEWWLAVVTGDASRRDSALRLLDALRKREAVSA